MTKEILKKNSFVKAHRLCHRWLRLTLIHIILLTQTTDDDLLFFFPLFANGFRFENRYKRQNVHSNGIEKVNALWLLCRAKVKRTKLLRPHNSNYDCHFAVTGRKLDKLNKSVERRKLPHVLILFSTLNSFCQHF